MRIPFRHPGDATSPIDTYLDELFSRLPRRPARMRHVLVEVEDHLRDSEPSPEVLHLLGLIRDAGGNLPEAAEYYRKALYLDPNHHQSLVHLALLQEKQGDNRGAKVLNERLRRLDRQERKQHA